MATKTIPLISDAVHCHDFAKEGTTAEEVQHLVMSSTMLAAAPSQDVMRKGNRCDKYHAASLQPFGE
jgi:hypothetical protein